MDVKYHNTFQSDGYWLSPAGTSFLCHLHYISYDNESCAVLSHLHCVQLFGIIWTRPHQAPLSMRFSRQGYWSGLPCSPSGDLPAPGIVSISPMSPAWVCSACSLPLEPPGKPDRAYTEPFLQQNWRMTLKSQTKHEYMCSQTSWSKGFFDLKTGVDEGLCEEYFKVYLANTAYVGYI